MIPLNTPFNNDGRFAFASPPCTTPPTPCRPPRIVSPNPAWVAWLTTLPDCTSIQLRPPARVLNQEFELGAKLLLLDEMDEVVLGSTLENERWRVGFGRRRGGSAEAGVVVAVVGILKPDVVESVGVQSEYSIPGCVR